MEGKIILLLAFCALSTAYTDLDDTLIVENVVKDKATLKKRLDCYLDRSPCTPQDEGYKSHFTEIVADHCKECNDVERHMFRVFIVGVREQLPEDYELFKAKYDPTGSNFDATMADVNKY